MFNKLSDVAFVGNAYVKGPVKAVALSFHGLGYTNMKTLPETDELELAYHGGLCVFPYCSPWGWMNEITVKVVDEIVRRVYAECGVPGDVPLILRGGSMGGHAALNYALHGAKTPAAVAVVCPAVDLTYHMNERPDLPRTFLYAYGFGPKPFAEELKENTPSENAQRMPYVPYLVIHGTADHAVNKAAHSDIFVDRMRETGHEVEYIEAEGMEHCVFADYAVFRRYMDFTLGFFMGDKS